MTNRLRIVATGALALLVAGCGECTLIGCVNGLRVELSAPVQGPWRVEASSPDAGNRIVECAADTQCTESFFDGYLPESVTLTLVAGGDTLGNRTVQPTYQQSQPNGARCGPTCTTGETSLEVRP